MTGVGLVSKLASGAKLLSKVSKASRVLGKAKAVVKTGVSRASTAALRFAAKHRILPNAVQRIGQHGAKRMVERGVTRRMVNTAVRKGERYWDPKNRSVAHVLRGRMASGKDLLVGRNPITGKITTTITGKRLIRARMERLR
jgi:hypothetical protein